MSSRPASNTTPGTESVNTAISGTRLLDSTYAGFFARFIAFCIDIMILAIFLHGVTTLAAGISGVWEGGTAYRSEFYFLSLLFFHLFAFVYFTWFHALGGQTVGKMVLNIRVEAHTGGGLGWARSVFRFFGYYISSAIFFAGFIWSLFDKDCQAWHDKLAGTVVLEN